MRLGIALCAVLACGGCGDGGGGAPSCGGHGVEVQATTGVTSETTEITVSHEACQQTLTFTAGAAMGEIKTAFETDLVEGDQVSYQLSMTGTSASKLCTVSAEGVSLGYVRANGTPVGTIECGCGFVGSTDPCM